MTFERQAAKPSKTKAGSAPDFAVDAARIIQLCHGDFGRLSGATAAASFRVSIMLLGAQTVLVERCNGLLAGFAGGLGLLPPLSCLEISLYLIAQLGDQGQVQR
jgi:hypothetical protein